MSAMMVTDYEAPTLLEAGVSPCQTQGHNKIRIKHAHGVSIKFDELLGGTHIGTQLGLNMQFWRKK